MVLWEHRVKTSSLRAATQAWHSKPHVCTIFSPSAANQASAEPRAYANSTKCRWSEWYQGTPSYINNIHSRVRADTRCAAVPRHNKRATPQLGAAGIEC